MTITYRNRQEGLMQRIGLTRSALPMLLEGRLSLFTKPQQDLFALYYGLELSERQLDSRWDAPVSTAQARHVRDIISDGLLEMWKQDHEPVPDDIRDQSFAQYCTIRRTYRALQDSIAQWARVKRLVWLLNVRLAVEYKGVPFSGISVRAVIAMNRQQLEDIKDVGPFQSRLVRDLLAVEGLKLRGE